MQGTESGRPLLSSRLLSARKRPVTGALPERRLKAHHGGASLPVAGDGFPGRAAPQNVTQEGAENFFALHSSQSSRIFDVTEVGRRHAPGCHASGSKHSSSRGNPRHPLAEGARAKENPLEDLINFGHFLFFMGGRAMFFIAGGLICGIIAAIIASSKERSAFCWFRLNLTVYPS